METPDPSDNSRAERLAERRGWRRRAGIACVAIVVAAGAVGVYWLMGSDESRKFDDVAAVDHSTSSTSTSATVPTTTTTVQPTTTTTIAPLVQPADVALPALAFGSLRQGQHNDTVRAYEQRLRDLHFDPGPIDGLFDQKTRYAVETVEKQAGLPRDGVITADVQAALQHWVWAPAMPTAEGDRVEIDLDRQVLTAYKNWQPILITTTSTGSGEHFCGGDDGCQYAITPVGRFHFTWHANGWQKSKLGRLYEPYYFNGGIAVHGYTSVPTHPASHGCARIPMHVAEYFDTLVHRDEAVYVVGTQMKPGGTYVAPTRPHSPPPPPPPTAPPATAPPQTVAPPTAPPPTKPPTMKPPTTPPTTKPPTTTAPPTTASPPTS